ncbi:MAG: gliding motility-associated ABC transporter ATP-binding subunit GldA [Bacteroidales bacterium]|nr:gliding motility-associated ABC transporter ATP-binding subunit GldA [Bacteroidales bacterium]MBN2698568.1 gliding motility-associated ABC transporter ATP-binding subunit GldA [Bacteroidales bacterium]
MSVKIQNISKVYGNLFALDNVSFEIGIGEVVGFIGPNGAGKSTTMKIMTGFIPPDSGEIWMNGINALEHPMAIKKLIGYLPEHNPLYQDLYVNEYLHYVAGIYRLDRKTSRKKIEEIIELTGLWNEQKKKIGNLSKGNKQRLGLAQALIHDPEILILDEPTSGLDPNQIIEIRNLISVAGKKKTVFLSTHIMQEVEAICDRVIIINNGRIIADDKPENLAGLAPAEIKTVLVETDKPVGNHLWKDIQEIEHIREMNNCRYLLETKIDKDIRPLIFNLAVKHGFTILSMTLREKSLEELFHELTHS